MLGVTVNVTEVYISVTVNSNPSTRDGVNILSTARHAKMFAAGGNQLFNINSLGIGLPVV